MAGAVRLNLDTWLGPEADEAAREAVSRMQRRAFDVQLAAEAAGVEPEPVDADIDLSAVRARCLCVSGAHDLADFREVAVSIPQRLGGGRATSSWRGPGTCPAWSARRTPPTSSWRSSRRRGRREVVRPPGRRSRRATRGSLADPG